VQAVNLLPRDEPKKGDKRPAAPVLIGLATVLVVLVVVGGGYFLESAKVAQKQTDVDAARAELALVPPPPKPDPVVLTLATQEGQRVAAVQGALNGRIAWDRLLREISRVLPADVWLSSLGLQAPTAAVAPAAGVPPTAAPDAGATTFTMDGNAYSHKGVARLLTRLALVPDLENITLKSSTRVVIGKKRAVQFSIAAGIRSAGGAS
jgi:Tfp pilus assembly protein PilN